MIMVKTINNLRFDLTCKKEKAIYNPDIFYKNDQTMYMENVPKPLKCSLPFIVLTVLH